VLAEGIRKFGLVESARISEPTRFYYGISTSRYSEPLDQLDVFLLLSRLRKMGLEVELTVFVAGRYAQLNGRPKGSLAEAEQQKTLMLEQSKVIFDQLPVKVFCTKDLWSSLGYWKEIDRLKGLDGIIDRSRVNGPLFCEVFESLDEAERLAIPTDLLKSLGQKKAAGLYRLFEVAEAACLRDCALIEAKVGPAAEEQYDRYIKDFMDIVQLKQPLDFRSRPKCVKPITPYIGNEGEERVFLSDTKEELITKIRKLAQRASDQPLLNGFMNPFVRLSVLAVEAAAIAESVPVSFMNRQVSDGAAVLDKFETVGTRRLSALVPVVAECLWAYIIRPLQLEAKNRGDAS